ncbi:MAG TPA: DUF3500 domain-containing protein [Chloroflexota bacterium]
MATTTSWYSGFRPRQNQPTTSAHQPFTWPAELEHFRQLAQSGMAEPFTGLTTDGTVREGLFPLQATGVSTARLRDAALAVLDAFTPAQRADACFPLDSPIWRAWSNVHLYIMRHGACLEDMTGSQREAALALVAEALSVEGFEEARNVMRLNHTIREITGSTADFGEWYYWLSFFGTPSATEPWGWQIDGHHLIVNCLVLGDRVVMTPVFMGSEPVLAETGKYAGTRVFEREESAGIALMQTLSAAQRDQATIGAQVLREVAGGQFKDNLVAPYEGIRYDALSGTQQGLLRDVIEAYVGRMAPAPAAGKRAEVRAHLDETHFAWRGDQDANGVFYYRVYSPVLWIEFDHLPGIALDNDYPTRNHIHTVVRTPNGNDYGKDLLRQHYARYPHKV